MLVCVALCGEPEQAVHSVKERREAALLQAVA